MVITVCILLQLNVLFGELTLIEMECLPLSHAKLFKLEAFQDGGGDLWKEDFRTCNLSEKN